MAQAYCKAAMNHWRNYTPTLQSEGVIRDKSIPYSLIFAMAGLEMEAADVANFPCHLTESEVRHALRYITRELNGFPKWFELMHRTFPTLVLEAVIKELMWELKSHHSDVPMHYILHDIVYYAPWLHAQLAPVILKWIQANPTSIKHNRHDCLSILVNGGVETIQLILLAKRQIEQSNNKENTAWWYALYVDCDPENAISEFETWLLTLDEDDANHAAQVFITMLLGGRHSGEAGSYIGNFRTVEYLKPLYILMSNYIRTSEDMHRANGGVYSPTLRDDAQNARDRLFTLLAEISGKACFIALKELALEHPDSSYRNWMAKRAYKRAEDDGDLELWITSQIYDFDSSQRITPKTHRQLFDLTVHRLFDLKNWLECGNDSPWETWQRAEHETEMRKLIAGWLNHQCRGQYTTAQEPELANSQRMDIWMQNTNVHSPVPIELKLLDKNWSGPKLCERLRNQLAGDYLREESAGCGVMLLVSQKMDANRKWEINNHRVVLTDLEDALKNYWQSIAGQYSGVEAIEVIVIDLTQRGQVSNS